MTRNNITLIYVKDDTKKQIEEIKEILKSRTGFEMANLSRSAIVREAIRRFYLEINGGKYGSK